MARCSTDLSEISLIPPLVTLFILSFPFHFFFISMVLDLLSLSPLPLYIVSFHLLHFVTQMTFWLFSFPLPVLTSSLFLCPRCIAWYLLFSLCCYLSEVSTLISGLQSCHYGAVVRCCLPNLWFSQKWKIKKDVTFHFQMLYFKRMMSDGILEITWDNCPSRLCPHLPTLFYLDAILQYFKSTYDHTI